MKRQVSRHVVNPVLGMQRKADPWGVLVTLPAKLLVNYLNERPCLEEQGGELPTRRLISGLQVYVHSCEHMIHMHWCTHDHTGMLRIHTRLIVTTNTSQL